MTGNTVEQSRMCTLWHAVRLHMAPALMAVAILILPLQVAAQGLFAPVARVDDSIITNFEVEQRALFLTLLNAPGATRSGALESLIDDRLRQQAIKEAGLELTEEGLAEGLSEFAARGELTTEEFVSRIEAAGVSRETFRDFVTVSLGWRELIRARYSPRIQIGEAEIDRALAAAGTTSGVRVLLSEIVIPAEGPQREEVQALAEEIATSRNEAEFADYARSYSATASRGNGGRLPWTDLSALPPQLAPLVLGLDIGEVTQPLPLPNAIALFQLRGIEETGAPTEKYAAIEYATYFIDGGRTEETLRRATDIAARVDVCDDLYGIAKDQPEEVLDRISLPPGDIPTDIALELSKLDPGEVSTALTRADGQALMFLMLCGRTAVLEEEVDRAAVANSLRSQRLAAFSDSLLAELRANSNIVILSE